MAQDGQAIFLLSSQPRLSARDGARPAIQHKRRTHTKLMRDPISSARTPKPCLLGLLFCLFLRSQNTRLRPLTSTRREKQAESTAAYDIDALRFRFRPATGTQALQSKVDGWNRCLGHEILVAGVVQDHEHHRAKRISLQEGKSKHSTDVELHLHKLFRDQ